MKLLNSWGLHPGPAQHSHPIYWISDLAQATKHLAEQQTTSLAFGNGRSYGDSCLAHSNEVLHLKHLNKFISANWSSGIICAEAGVTLDEILQLCTGRGWFLPVTPGTKYATLGGAIANDVHGKNHHKKGTFGCHVLSLDIIRSDTGRQRLSPTQNQSLFNATIGGLGLTGIISSVCLQLIPIQSSYINVTTQPFRHLTEFFELSDELDQHYDYCVAWIDCLATGKNIGRGIFEAGNHSRLGGLDLLDTHTITIPITPPISLVNAFTIKAFNALYYNKACLGRKHSVKHYDSFFYPLDSINHWNKLYGARGFQQYQCVIPNLAAKGAIKEILKQIAHHQHGSFLAVLKRCGNIRSPSSGLSFPIEGVSLALDFANNARLKPLFKSLDAIVSEAQGRLYPAKDAHMSAELFQQSYPNWQIVEQHRDPVLLSKFWARVTQ